MSKYSILKTHRNLLFFVIDAAEASMPRHQFRAFKKLVFDHYHQVIQPALYLELGVGKLGPFNEPQSQVGAVLNDDREGGCHED